MFAAEPGADPHHDLLEALLSALRDVDEAAQGDSAGAYFQLIDRAFGQALSTGGVSMADSASAVQWAGTPVPSRAIRG